MKKQNSSTMPLSGHLRELRNRALVIVICLVLVFLIALYFSQGIISFLTEMGTVYGYKFVYLAPQELLLQQFSVSLIVAICLSLPVILYQVWAFIQPGLKKNENIFLVAALISGLICFILGILFAYKLMLPFMLRFLINLSSGSGITATISVQKYISFLLTIFLVFGFFFELPVVSVLLTQTGLLKVSWMRRATKFVIIGIFLISALVTPPDVISQIMVSVPMIILYEISILLSSVLLRFRKNRKSETEDGDEDEES